MSAAARILPIGAEDCSSGRFRRQQSAKPPKSRFFLKKTEESRKKPVETGLLPLTNALQRRKVNGGNSSEPASTLAFPLCGAIRKQLGAGNRWRFLPAQSKGKHKEEDSMAATMTKTALVRQLAEKLELTNKQSAAYLDLLAETAIKETKKNGVFVIPGLGRLVKAERKARMGRNPQTGEQIKIKAKTVVKFRVAKSAKDSIAPPKK
ncbi:MAG TPA: HU family DNA-binding protein [Acidobacteriaceae bacterium]|nr:HU family DNA-binding protein [Acidobacteriaceae bacterium]